MAQYDILTLNEVYVLNAAGAWPNTGIGTEVTYSVTPVSTTADETTTANVISFDAFTTKVANGTVLYWTFAGNTNIVDFLVAANTGSFTVQTEVNGIGSYSATRVTAGTLDQDMEVEGLENIIVQLRTGSVTGTVVATSANINVSDTSVPLSGNLWVWGLNGGGQLGTNNLTPYSSPVQTVAGGNNWKSIAINQNTVAIKTDGTLWAWGDNSYGAAGNNTVTAFSSPVQTISGGTNWKYAGAMTRAVAAVKTDGTLWTWGQNNAGQLGDNTVVNKSSPIQTVAGGNNWKSVYTGGSFVGAIKTDGTLWMWGVNASGQLGTNSATIRSSPVQTVAGGTNWKTLPSIGSSTASFMGAIKTDGTLWMWGLNSFGNLGNNDIATVSSPVQTVAAGNNWKQLAISGGTNNYTAAIKTDGTLWTWGRNESGQLGDGVSVNPYSSPIQTIAGGTNWAQVIYSMNAPTIGAIKTDGTLWVWGQDGVNGTLGRNTINAKFSSPVQTIAGGTNWKIISAGPQNLLAIGN